MPFYSTKHYGHNIGLSAVFRQPNADHSHCHLLHGYSLAFTFKFGCHKLDNKNWAVDFGGLKQIKAWLEDSFDHKVVVDINDPYLDKLKELEALDLAELRIFDGVGAEKFAYHAFQYADKLIREKTNNRCWVQSVECAEHGANSAIYEKEDFLFINYEKED
jgi:6-pyruvoyltetrahydropterin/6-carboxytetrahydropterin synthase